MDALLRNIAAVLFGLLLGSMVNVSLITFGGRVIPPPASVNPADIESIRASTHPHEPKHFLFPFLAHALGTWFGAFVASLIAATGRRRLAFGLGGFFLLGGIAACFLISAPMWFMAADLLGAYLPMAWLAARMAETVRPPARVLVKR